MPTTPPDISVSPRVLKWARESAGYSEEDIAHRLHVSKETVQQWESLAPQPRLTVRRLEALSDFYKRPLAAFLLDEPPEETPPPKDFRRPSKENASFSPALRFAIRRAYRLQRIARELMETLGLVIGLDIPQAERLHEPEALASEQRRILGASVDQQARWKHARQAFDNWLDLLEQHHTLVLQADFLRQEAQGFSINTNYPHVIVVTADSKEAYTARSFTLFHEYGHLLRKEEGLCLIESALPTNNDESLEIEDWCNRFAEAFLIPEEDLARLPETRLFIQRSSGYQQALNALAKRFKVSREVVLFRLWHSARLSQDRFWTEYHAVKRMQEAQRASEIGEQQDEKEEGFAHPAYKAMHTRGKMFTRLVLESLDRDIISYTDAVDYLGFRLKHLDRVRRALSR